MDDEQDAVAIPPLPVEELADVLPEDLALGGEGASLGEDLERINGLAEAVVNPLVATCFPKNRTHYLNILHAGWPAGLAAGRAALDLFEAEKK